MDPKGQSILNLLFDADDEVCVSNNKYAYHSIPVKNAMDGRVTLLSEDPQQPTRYCDSQDLIFVAFNPMKGFRSDASVTKFRSFLFEIDMGSTKEQLGYFKQMGVPLSAQIFSGNRSVHALVVLKEPLDEKTYREYYVWALKILSLCDQQVKTPSKCVRIPGALREPGKRQRLISLGDRVDLKTFETWLYQHENCRPKIKPKKEVLTGEADYSKLGTWARYVLKNGIGFSRLSRNQTWYALAKDFANAGFSEDQATEILADKFTEESDFREKEWRSTITSAFKDKK